MIVFLVTEEHRYTLKDVVAGAGETRIQIASYGELFGSTHLLPATYVFTDLDRLPAWQVRQAARSYRALRDQGARVLNDPARLPSRFGLLRQLALSGHNQFNAYRVEEGVIPARWPVFLRSEGDHGPPLSDLLHTWDEVRREAEAALDAGRAADQPAYRRIRRRARGAGAVPQAQHVQDRAERLRDDLRARHAMARQIRQERHRHARTLCR
ncbi:MAG: hypothetical protein WDN69_37850 [Aliidongia sp.]